MTEKQRCEAMIYRSGPGIWPGEHDHCERPAKWEIQVRRITAWGSDDVPEPFTMHVCGVHERTIHRYSYSRLTKGTGEITKDGWRKRERTIDVQLVREKT